MTNPEDPTPATTPETPAHWEETRSTLSEIFQGKPAAVPETPEPAAPGPDKPEPGVVQEVPAPAEQPVEAATFEPVKGDPAALAETAPAATVVPVSEPVMPTAEIAPEAVKSETLAPAVAEAPVAEKPVVVEPGVKVAPTLPVQTETPAPQAEPPKGVTPPEAVVPPVASPTTPPEPETAPASPLPVAAPPAKPQPTPTPPSTGFSDDLEEEVFAPTAPVQGPQAGAVVSGFHLNEDLGRGWFTANEVTSGPSRDVYVKPDPQWAALLPHRLLPRTSRVGDLYVLEPVEGERLTTPMPTLAALKHLGDLARLLFALEKQGYAVTDLDPTAMRVTPDGLKLRFPPRVAKLDTVSEPVLREGFTPPEVLEGKSVQPQTGVYLLGALLYGWLTGRSVPPEGVSPAMLGGVPAAGMPQLLNQMLAPVGKRLTPSALLDVLKAKTTATMPAYQVAATTTVGLNPDRPTNEDSYGFTWRQIDADGSPEQVLRAVVSDGMGGMAAGEVASRAAVEAFLNSNKTTLTDMVWDANSAVLDAMQGRDGGCTISAVEVQGDRVQLGHVGDSRAYFYRGSELEQISKDHSYVAAMVASGQMTAEEALSSPDRNKVLRSLGSVRQPQVNYVHTLPEPLTMHLGDRVLLVSDGVWGEVPDSILKDLLGGERNLQAVTDKLIDLALQAGAPDNATALLIERVK